MASDTPDRGPSWKDIATQLRLWDVEGVRYAGVAMMEEPPSGMLDFPETVALQVKGWTRGAWQGFGPGFAVGESVSAGPRLRYLLPLVVDSFYGAMASAGEVLGTLRSAGRRHRGTAPPMADESVRWFDYLLSLPGATTEYELTVKCHDGRSETVRVHEIPDLLRASIDAIRTLSAQPSDQAAAPLLSPAARVLWEYLVARQAGPAGGVVPTYDDIEAESGMTRNTISRSFKELRTAGIVQGPSRGPLHVRPLPE